MFETCHFWAKRLHAELVLENLAIPLPPPPGQAWPTDTHVPRTFHALPLIFHISYSTYLFILYTKQDNLLLLTPGWVTLSVDFLFICVSKMALLGH